MGANRCRSAAGLYYFNRLRRTDWLPIRKVVDPDEDSDRGPTSDASSYDDGSDDESDCSTLRSRSEGYLSSDGNLSELDTEFDDDGYPIIEDGPDLGDEGGYVPTHGLTEPLNAYADLVSDRMAKRRKTAE